MKNLVKGLAIGVLALSATAAVAAPGGMRGMSTTTRAPTAPTVHMSTAPATRPAAQPRALGQPNQSCGSATAPNTPGNAAMAPGSAFNPDGNAGTHYAGQQPQNSRNTARG